MMSLSEFLSYPPRGVGAVVLAGGRGRRLGGVFKGDIEIGRATILSQIERTIAPQVTAMAISVRGDTGAASSWTQLADDETFEGPLAGLLSALRWAKSQGFGSVLTIPSDTPFLPHDLLLRLAHGLGSARAAIAASSGWRHPTVGLWNTGCIDPLLSWLGDGKNNRIGDFADSLGANIVEWPESQRDPFLNVNTPEDRRQAEVLWRSTDRLAGTALLPDDVSSEALMAEFVAWAKSQGLSVGGLLQRSDRSGPNGSREFFMTDLGTGETVPIMQRLGRTMSCAIDTRAMADATKALRAAIKQRPDIVIINKFGHLEEEGGGMIDEMLAIMAHDLPLLISVTEKRLDNWLARCGGMAELLAPDLSALQAWWHRSREIPVTA